MKEDNVYKVEIVTDTWNGWREEGMDGWRERGMERYMDGWMDGEIKKGGMRGGKDRERERGSTSTI